MRNLTILRSGTSLLAVASLAGCAVGPNYQRPTAPVETSFKESQGWTPSQPADAADRGAWWSVFKDPVLDGLEKRVAVSDQNLLATEAVFNQALALVAQSQSQYFPTIAATGSESTSRRPAAPTGAETTTNVYNAALGASWAPDLWGRIRRTNEANRDNAEAAAANVASAELLYQAQVATDYFTLRVLDEEKTLLNDTTANYQRVVTVTNNKYNAGVSAKTDLITAQTQLENAQAAAADLGVQRAQTEHAIAMLIGVTPADLTIAPAPATRNIPVAPTGLASTLLERRPDVASAERTMAAANAQIGVAVSAYFPNLTLTGSYGYQAPALSGLFSASNAVWSVGPQLAETLIDFGARRAQVKNARAVYDQRVAQYRQTVLAAFQGVEDQIAALRVLEQEASLRNTAETSARQAETLTLNQYNAGQVDFTTVVTAENTALTAETNSLNVLRARLTASVALIQNLGGGWTDKDIPSVGQKIALF